MKKFRYGIALGLLAGLGACSNMTGGGSSRPHGAAMTQPTVAPEMVRQVQAKLRDDGYYKQGAVDGVWGSGTETAVRSFQRDHNLGVNGELDVPTLAALNLPGAPAATANPAAGNPPTGNPPMANPPVGNPTTDNAAPTQPMNTNQAPNTPPADNTNPATPH